MSIFRTAESFDVVRYTPDGLTRAAHDKAFNIPTIFFNAKEGLFKPMPIFEFMRYLYAKNSDRFNDYAQLKQREDKSLVVLLNNVDMGKANEMIALINELSISAQKAQLYLATQLNSDALLKSFEQWLLNSGEYKSLQLNHQLETFDSAENGLELMRQNEKLKPVVLTRLIMKFKAEVMGNSLVQYI